MGLTELFVADRAQTTVTSGGTDAPVSGTVETWIVASSAMFGVPVANVSQFHVSDPFAPSEIIAVTAVSVTTWTVTRGADGTTPVPHAAGFLVFQTTTAGFLAAVLTPATTAGGDLGGAYPDPEVTATHLAVPLTAAQGGVGQVSFSPVTYGATGNGIADDTTYVRLAAAAAIAAKGILDLGTFTFKTSSPVTVASGFHVKGAGPGGGSIVSSASDIFTFGATAYNVAFENCTLTSNTGGGHIFNASTGPLIGGWTFSGCYLTQNNAAKCIWYQNNGLILNFLVNGNGRMTCSGSATVSPWTIINIAGGANTLKFSETECSAGAGATAPFFLIDPGYSAHTDTGIVGMTATSFNVTDANAVAADVGLAINSANFTGGSAVIQSITSSPTGYVVSKAAIATLSGQTCLIGNRGTNSDAVFENITWEVCAGGGVAMTAVYDVLIKQCYNYDIAAAGLKANFYSFTKSNTGFACISIRLSGGLAGGGSTLGSGFNDFYADSFTKNIRIDSFGSPSWLPVISSPSAQTTITNPTGIGTPAAPVTTFPGPIAVTGTTGASAGGRYIGCTPEPGGAPTSGTFFTGDFCNDVNGLIWLCTAGGTHGTWVSGAPIPPDIQFFTTNGTWHKPAGAQTVFATVMPSGGSAGSGASGPSGTALSGGAGGGAGMIVQRQFAASDCGATEAVTVGAAVSGGAPVTGMSSPRGPETCGITTTTTSVTDVNAIAGDVGRSITGTGIPPNAYIKSVNTGTSTYTISAAATATNASASLTIGAFTAGNPGANGNASQFGNLLYGAAGAGLGGAGNVVAATGGLGPLAVAGTPGAGASGVPGAAGTTIQPGNLGSTGGPSGGGITAGGTAEPGAAGLYSYLDFGGVGGTAGEVAGASPGQGTVSAVANGNIGPSAGSGAASVTGAAQGGANTLPNTGAGGPGGGASLNGNASGQGGNSGSGWVLVISYFQ